MGLRKRVVAPDSNTKAKARHANKSTRKIFLVDLPLDVLYEILCRVTPLDLLQMARISKAFRQILMSRASVTIWVRARETTYEDMPAPGHLMAEPAWISLLFETQCTICGQYLREVDLDLGMRICRFCSPEVLMDQDDPKVPRDLACKAWRSSYTGMPRWKYNNYPDFPFERFLIYRPHFEEVTKMYSLLESEEERLVFVKERHALVESWNAFCQEIKSGWLKNWARSRRNIWIVKERMKRIKFAEEFDSYFDPDELEDDGLPDEEFLDDLKGHCFANLELQSPDNECGHPEQSAFCGAFSSCWMGRRNSKRRKC